MSAASSVNDWPSLPLKRFIRTIESGVSVNAVDLPAPEGALGVLKTSAVYSGVFDPGENKQVVPDEMDRVACPVRPGTLIVSRMNTPDLVGAAAVVLRPAPGLYLPDRLWQVEFVNLHPGFADYWTKTELYRSQVRAACAGTSASMQNLAQEDFKNFALQYPPPDWQQRVVRFLDRETARIDALIEKKTRFIELLREKRQALITQAVTQGLDPSVPIKDSGVAWLGRVPAHWEVRPLKWIARVQTGVAKGKDNVDKETIEVPYLRVANVQDGRLDLEDVATIPLPKGDLLRYLLQPGDVLMNEGGDFDKLGRGHVWRGEIAECVHQNHVFAVRPHAVSSDWLNLFTSSGPAQFYFMGRSKQSTNLASISSSNLMELPVPVPPDHEQAQLLSRLGESLDRLERLHRANATSIDLLSERRSALITAAVTGQIDLREAA